MAVKLRLRRMGRKKRPIYAVVAADTRSPRDGRFIEDLGRYYPIEEPAVVSLKEDRVLYWLEQGAQPSDTVRSLLSRQGLLLAASMRRKGKSDDEIQAAIEQHRTAKSEKAERGALTASARRQQALEAERKRVAEVEAKAARERAEAEAAKRREQEERRRAEEARKIQEAEKASEPEVKKEDQVSATQVPGGPEPEQEAEIQPETQKEEKAAATATADQETSDKKSGKPTEVSPSEPEVKKEDQVSTTQVPGGPEPTKEDEISPETQKEEKAAATKGDDEKS